MARFTNPLQYVQIAAPCQADWNEMYAFGGDRVRYCSQCQLNVYNLSAMTQREAEALLMTTEGRLCVRFYRRADGTILTQNCPVGWRAIKQRVSWVVQLILGMVIGLLAHLGLMSFVREQLPTSRIESSPVMGGISFPVTEQHESLAVGNDESASPSPLEAPKSPPRKPKPAARAGATGGPNE